jgi:5'-3' exonuclease
MVQAAPKHGVMPGSDILRHMIMDSVRMNVAQFKSFNKPVVIASDGRASWRKDIFKYYKFKRPEERAKLAPNVDWKVIYELITEIVDDFEKNFPFVCVRNNRAEGDDIVGALVKHYHAQNQFDGIMIISGDKDFKQLHYDSRIRQYSPVLKDYVKSEGAEIERKKIILSGDRLDGVPNVLSPDNSFADKIRQRKLMPKIKAELMAYASPDDIREAVIKRNYYRNMVLTDLNMTPKDIRADIIEQFETKRNKLPPTMKVFNYLVSKQLVELSSKAGDFII